VTLGHVCAQSWRLWLCSPCWHARGRPANWARPDQVGRWAFKVNLALWANEGRRETEAPEGFPGSWAREGRKACPGRHRPIFSDFIGDMRSAIIFINLPFSQGSGVRISPTEIITAEHMITGASRVDACLDGGIFQEATVTGYDTVRDLALLTTDTPADGLTVRLPVSN